jgi:hypothetical protein
MKRTVLLLTAVLVITYLSSPPVMAASSSQGSRTLAVMKILYHQFLGFRAPSLSSKDFIVVIDGSGDIELRGDADDYGGGKIDDKRGNLDDLGAIPVDGIDITKTSSTR